MDWFDMEESLVLRLSRVLYIDEAKFREKQENTTSMLD